MSNNSENYNELRKIWEQNASNADQEFVKAAIAESKEKEPFYHTHLGPTYSVIMDLQRTQFVWVSKNAEEVTGFEHGVYLEKGPKNNFLRVSPMDMIALVRSVRHNLKFIHTMEREDYPHLRFIREFRYRHKKGNYIWLMQQINRAYVDEKGKIPLISMQISDISEYKTDHLFKYHIFHAKENKILYRNKYFQEEAMTITNRELEILTYIARGLSTPQISDELDIERETVKSHRKNILKKMNVGNMTEVVILAMQNGWI